MPHDTQTHTLHTATLRLHKIMAPKRAAAGDADAGTEEHKRFKSAMAEAAEEFLCLITHELPVHPVMAEDGHIYERSEIEKWIRVSAQEGGARSSRPTTNEEMGERLTEAVRARTNIRRMVESGAIACDKAAEWQKALEEEVAALRRMAEGGDADAMTKLGYWYEFGKKGLPKDDAQAFA